MQDYYPAAYGGIQAIHFSASGVLREEIQLDPERLSERLILIYSGQQRNSGINNWDVMKRHIDGDREVFRAFEGIIAAANKTLEALRSGSFDAIDDALAEEWANRRVLSSGITTRKSTRSCLSQFPLGPDPPKSVAREVAAAWF